MASLYKIELVWHSRPKSQTLQKEKITVLTSLDAKGDRTNEAPVRVDLARDIGEKLEDGGEHDGMVHDARVARSHGQAGQSIRNTLDGFLMMDGHQLVDGADVFKTRSTQTPVGNGDRWLREFRQFV